MDNEKKVLFDPGYAPLVMETLGQIGYNYYIFSASRNYKAKKLNFPHMLRKFEGLIKTNIAFYLGCLMWAIYIKHLKDYEIVENKLLNDQCDEDEYTNEIDFLIDFINNQLPKDAKYYINKSYEAPSEYNIILEKYRELLVLNKGFVECDNTSKIKLPKKIKRLDKLKYDKIYSSIQEAIKNKNIDLLLDSYSLIL